MQDLACQACSGALSRRVKSRSCSPSFRYGHEYSGGWIISSPRNLPGVDYERLGLRMYGFGMLRVSVSALVFPVAHLQDPLECSDLFQAFQKQNCEASVGDGEVCESHRRRGCLLERHVGASQVLALRKPFSFKPQRWLRMSLFRIWLRVQNKLRREFL